ncbi:hypothetical protein ABEX44_25705 [Priestia megaterium]
MIMVDIGLYEWVEEEDVLGFLKDFFTDTSAWGSIIGGILGGLITYWGVILTFKNEKKNSYPEKLVKLTEMIFRVEDYKSALEIHRKRLENDVPEGVSDVLDLENFNREIIKMAAMVDKKTYGELFNLRENMISKDILRAFDPTVAMAPSTAFEVGEPVPHYIDLVMSILKNSVSYYEKKI